MKAHVRISMAFSAGRQLTENELMSRLNWSRTTLRNALRYLLKRRLISKDHLGRYHA